MFRHRHIQRLLRWQSDIVEPEHAARVSLALDRLKHSWRRSGDLPAVEAALDDLERTAADHLEDPSKSHVRESYEILFVALVFILALQTFAAQPMVIPSGSMQPTLCGVRVANLKTAPRPLPTDWRQRLWHWLWYGRRYFQVVLQADGKVEAIGPVERMSRFPYVGGFQKQEFRVGTVTYALEFLPENLPNPFSLPPEDVVLYHAGVRPDVHYRRGEEILKLMTTAGDHILVDRLTYNFRRPRRGEIVVFRGDRVSGLPGGGHYIKRLVGLGGERVRIGDDRHVRINGRRLDSGTPGFEGVYGFEGPPKEDHYSGHLNDMAAQAMNMKPGSLASKFPNQRTEFQVRARHFLVLGDNTVSSYDSRRFGDIPQDAVIGRHLMSYWPFARQ